jgi:hypothetical protein
MVDPVLRDDRLDVDVQVAGRDDHVAAHDLERPPGCRDGGLCW